MSSLLTVKPTFETVTPTGQDDPFWSELTPIEVPQEQLLACPALQLELRELIGEGAYGRVFKACEQADCRKVVKVQILPDNEAQNDFVKEANFTSIASDNDFGPRLFSACVTDGKRLFDLFTGRGRFSLVPLRDQPSIGLMVSELWDGSLEEIIADRAVWCARSVFQALESRVARMHELGIVHADLLPKNVLYKHDQSGRIIDLIPTDFGVSFYATDFATFPVDWQFKLAQYNLKNPNQPTWSAIEQTPRLRDVTWEDIQQDPFLLDEPLLVQLRRMCIAQ